MKTAGKVIVTIIILFCVILAFNYYSPETLNGASGSMSNFFNSLSQSVYDSFNPKPYNPADYPQYTYETPSIVWEAPTVCEYLGKPIITYPILTTNITAQQAWQESWDETLDDVWNSWMSAYKQRNEPVCGADAKTYKNPYYACLKVSSYYIGAC